MEKEKLDPYYERKSKRDSQEILFWMGIAGAAILCAVVFGHILEGLGLITMPQWLK